MRSRNFATGKAVQMALVAQVLGHRQCLIEALRLEHYADCAAHGGGIARDIVTGNFGAAAGGRHHGGEDAEERGFPAAVRPQQAEDLACLDFEVDIRKRQARSVLMAQVLGENHNPGLSNSISP